MLLFLAPNVHSYEKFRLNLNEINNHKKVIIMKKKKKKLSISLSVFIIGFLLSSSSLNIVNAKTLVKEELNQFNTDSLDSSVWTWTITEVISTVSDAESYYPSLAVDDKGNIHVAWDDRADYAGAGTDPDIFYKRWDAATSSWTTTEVVSTESTAASFYLSLAVDTFGNVHITWQDWTDYAGNGIDGDIFYKRWDAATSSWNTTEVVSTESTGESYFPSLAVDTFGNVHIAWEDWTDYASGNWDIFYKRWDVSTSSWTTTEVVSTVSTSGSDFPSLATDTLGNLHIAWEDRADYAGAGTDVDIFYRRWNASNSSWTTTEVVSTESTEHSQKPSLAVDSAKNVYIAWDDDTNYTSAGTDRDIFYKRWDAATSSWNTTEVVSTESTEQSDFPSLAVDTFGNVHLAWTDWTDYAGAGTDADIFYKQLDGPPIAPELSPILPNPTDNDTILLDWNDVSGASVYYVYRSTSYISSVEILTPINTEITTSYEDTLPSEGIYFYVIVASDGVKNSTHSNCESVEYILSTVHEFGIVSNLIIVAIAIMFVVMRTRKKKTKLN